MSDFDDLETIANQNSRSGARDKSSYRGPKIGRGKSIGAVKKPKWRNQLRAFKIMSKKAVNVS